MTPATIVYSGVILFLTESLVRMPKLILRSDAFDGGAIELLTGHLPVTLGRSRRADITIRDGLLSRKHAEIRLNHDGQFEICDLDSTNLTIVNEREVSQHVLNSGDRILLGDTLITVEVGQPAVDLSDKTTREITIPPDDTLSSQPDPPS